MVTRSVQADAVERRFLEREDRFLLPVLDEPAAAARVALR